MSAETRTQALTFLGGLIVLSLVAICIWNLWPASDRATYNDALVLSRVTVVSLAIVVALLGGLAVIYSVLNLTNTSQPLGLPEGSIRALISFSLVFVFVCMSSFIYSGLSGPDLVQSQSQLKGLNKSQIDDLKSNFTVVYQPSRTGNPKFDYEDDGKTQLYDATYYTKRGTGGDDFAKQLFTTLATVFVSVVSFYFGSSTTTSAISAANAATGTSGRQGGAEVSGQKGTSGATGSQGTSGATGSRGTSGATGSQGTSGATGSRGASGATGSQGASGATGSQGASGATGP